MNDLGHLKRASSCDAEDPSGKKPRVTASLIHNSEEGEALDVRVSGENKPAPVEENGHRTLSSGAKVIRESMENSTKEDGSCNSGALNRCTNQLPIIEADAAEDRGSRHSMEDAWVVLPDASMDFPGTLSLADNGIKIGMAVGNKDALSDLDIILEGCREEISERGRSQKAWREFGGLVRDGKPWFETLISSSDSVLEKPTGVHILQFSMDMVVVLLLSMHKSIYMKMFFQLDYHMDIKAAKKAIHEGFQKTDESLLRESAAGGWQDGATAVCLWVLGQTVLVANIGDSKAVLARSSPTDGSNGVLDEKGSTLKAIVITREHKAIYPKERARIQKAGGSVGINGRLQGRLEVSRAFGDCQFKKVGVIATPDVYSFDLTGREKFIILGCDGLWGVFGPSDAVDFVHKHLQDGLSATTVVRRLVREAVRERRCKDNCTAVLLVFKNR